MIDFNDPLMPVVTSPVSGYFTIVMVKPYLMAHNFGLDKNAYQIIGYGVPVGFVAYRSVFIYSKLDLI